MNNIIIGNMLMLIGSTIMIFCGIINKKNIALIVQTVQLAFMTAGMAVLGSIPAMVVNILGCTRNIIGYYGKLTRSVRIFLIIITTTISLIFNNIGVFGLIPIISSILFILLVDTKNIVVFKWLIAGTSALWVVHDLYVCAYTAVAFDILSIVTSVISVVRYKNKIKKQGNQHR